MTHSNLTVDYSRRASALRNQPLSQHMTLYSLFKKNGNYWSRCVSTSFTEKLAYRVFSDYLAKDMMNYSIRKIRIDLPEAK